MEFLFDKIVLSRASQKFQGYLSHSVLSCLSSELAGATLVEVSEG